MKVILLKDLKGTGKKGDIINTSDGHARNYLIPRGIAMEASDSNLRELDHQKANQKKKEDAALAEAQELAKKLSGIKVTFVVSTGEGGKLFGAITNKDVAEKLSELSGIELDKKKLAIDAIKHIGEFTAQVRLHPGVVADVKVHVTSN